MRNLTSASILLLISVFLTVAFGGITVAGTIYVDGDATAGSTVKQSIFVYLPKLGWLMAVDL